MPASSKSRRSAKRRNSRRRKARRRSAPSRPPRPRRRRAADPKACFETHSCGVLLSMTGSVMRYSTSHPELDPEPARAARRVEGRDTSLPESLADSPSAKRVCIGVVAGAQGVRGAVRIKSFTADPADIAHYGPLVDEAGERQFRLRVVGSAKGVLIAQIAGITDRDRAGELRGLRLYLPRDALPPAGEDEFY